MLETEGIYIDDGRTPIETPPFITGWVCSRSYEEFRDELFEYIRAYKHCPKIISFDHDLADEHYEFHKKHDIGTPPDYAAFKEKTGLHCARLLTEVCDKNKIDPPEYMSIHSHNPIGSMNIFNYLNYWKKIKGLEPNCFIMRYRFTLFTIERGEKEVEIKTENKQEEKHEPQG